MDQQMNEVAAMSFTKALAAALSVSVAQAGGSPWQLEPAEHQDLPERDAQPLAFRLKLEGKLNGDCFIEFYEPHLSTLLRSLNREATHEDSADRAKILTPVLTSAAAQLKTSLASAYGDLTFKVDPVSELTCGGMFVVPLRVQSEEPSSPSVFVYCNGALIEALSSASAGPDAGDAAGHQFRPANLRLVMDVELSVSLRFGQRQLPLREVLELASGSVIELDKMVDEPVEMLLDGKVVARGEAVIVDGNYGLRVTEIPQAMETYLHA